MDALRTMQYKGYTIELHQDQDPVNPRTAYDSLGKMVCFHNRGSYGDKHAYRDADEVMAHIKATKAVWLPVYGYDHGGMTVRTTPFSCPWDSGQLGVIFIERKAALEEMGAKALTKTVRTKVEAILRSEVETYDHYLTGQCYGYIIKHAGSSEESCWGFLGDDSYCLDEAKSLVDSMVKAEALKRASKVKAMIKHKVPLLARPAALVAG